MNPPPVIPLANGSASSLLAVQGFGGLLCLLAAARLSAAWNLPLPFCGLRRLTGVPCPFCGSTRSFQACSSFDFADALRWNPLAFLTFLGISLWFVLWTADRLFHQHWLDRCRLWLAAPALKPLCVGVVVLNWIYVCLTLP
jgi:Protein of unknown function (DUF2752)